MGKGKLLFTASSMACGDMTYLLEDEKEKFLHLPLESYEENTEKVASALLKENVDNFEFVIYGTLRNAIYFEKWMSQNKLLADFQNLVHFCLDKPTSEFLESNEIPAIQPRQHAKPIDILEFMLRISREGKTLYPSCSNKTEEMPGLLQELEMEAAEFTVCKEIGLTPEEVASSRETLSESDVSAILFHNRSAVTRTFAAFPDLNIKKLTVISGSAGVTQHLIGKGIEPHFEAEGSWYSIEKLVQKEYLQKT